MGKGKEFYTPHSIKCCQYCVAPKRYPGCHGSCPEYLQEKAEYEERKALADKQRKVSGDIYCQKSERVTKAIKKHGR